MWKICNYMVMQLDRIQNRIIEPDCTLLEAMKKMDDIKMKVLFVFCHDKFEGILTIGDIQRAIIKGCSLNNAINDILDRNKIYADVSESIDSIKKKMELIRAECMPVLNKGDLVKVYTWEELFAESDEPKKKMLDLPVVIMAGGLGTRLKPLTNVIPKPLVPVGDKTILEVIMDQFEEIGCRKFYMSVNYKADMMEYYLSKLPHKYDIEFFMENTPLGTIGSVALLKGKIKTPFFVSNCDSINDQDYRDVYDYHQNNHNDMTIVTMIKTFKIPYGVIETGEDGLMVALREKPEQTYMVNTGAYILNPDLIDEIPEGKFFHITDLMEKVKARGGRVGCFPVSEKAWHDMGDWDEYLRMINIKL